MFQQPWYLNVLPLLPILLVYLAGIVVAIVLLVRHRGTPAILALIGFGVLFVVALASLVKGPLVGVLGQQLARQMRMSQFWAVNAGLGCCCSVLDVIAIVCLIVAIWQALSSAHATGDEAVARGDEEVEEMVGEFVEIPDQPVSESE
ncbi:MAG: hypothetical protein DRI48_08965 [Chloroflexi bacterium]|nr:MAG: hypothetical protein DRI48_08965 [Chloroflexota bacterium]